MASSNSECIDSDYYKSYEDIAVHELMLKDRPRVLAYKTFLEENATLICDKVVLDVGAGSGILSVFAAKCGARHVYAVEASQTWLCNAVVNANDVKDKVTVIQGRVEEVSLPDNIKADVLISEWMGFYLLHESMLSSVINARDRLLKVGGLMLPSSADIFLAPVSLKDYWNDNINCWCDIYDIDLTPVATAIKESSSSKPSIMTVAPECCVSQPSLVSHLDLQFVDIEDIKHITTLFHFEMDKNAIVHGMACWFDVHFDGAKPIVLSTSPSSEPTHWKQTVIHFPDPFMVNKGDFIDCKIEIKRDISKPRFYEISLEIDDDDDEDSPSEHLSGKAALIAALETNFV